MRITSKMQSRLDTEGFLDFQKLAVRCVIGYHKALLAVFLFGLIVVPVNSPLLAQTLSPQDLKRQAIAELEQISTSQKYLQRIIKRAIKYVNESLEDKGRPHFLDGYRILPPPEGEKVFREERNAVQWLLIGLRLRRTPDEIKPVLSRVIDALVEADRIIAEVSIAVASQLVQAGVGYAGELAEAQREYERALGETNPRKAIQRYREAWESSQEVVNGRELVIKEYDLSPSPFSPSLTSNTLSATFQIYLKGRFHKDDDRGEQYRDNDDDDDSDRKKSSGDDNRRGSNKRDDDDDNDDRDDKKHPRFKTSHERPEKPLTLEFIEIIKDASGTIVRTLATEHSVPFPSPGYKGDVIELTVTSSWDGKGETDEIFPDGTYTYLAFGHMVKPASNGGKKRRPSKRWWHKYLKHRHKEESDHKEIIATSFPVSGAMVLDNTPPTITEAITPSPNSADWNNSDVTVSFSCSDSTTNIVSCSDPTMVSTEGPNQAVTGTAEDQAGNTATATASVNLDKTAPGVNIAAPVNKALLNVSEVTVTGTVTDALSGIDSATCNGIAASLTGSSFTCNVTLTEGPNTLHVKATDRAGNMGSSSIDVTVDTIPPVVAITDPIEGSTVNSSPVSFTGTVDDETATVLVNGIGPTVSNGVFTIDVPLLEGSNTVTVTGTDAAGNVGAASIQVILQTDTDPPDLVVVTPTNGSFAIQNQPNIEFSYTDQTGVDTTSFALTINGADLPLDCQLTSIGGRCIPTTELPEGPNTLVVSVEDLLGNKATKQVNFTVDTVPVEISITEPLDGLITKAGEILVSGTVGPNVTSLIVNGVEATFGSPFTATVPLREGTNMIVAVATKASGRTGTTSVDVTRDIVAPIVKIDSPRDGFISVNNTIAVTGLVNDIVNGATNAVVKVNGVEATVSGGAFMATDIPLVRGPNTIETVATDAVGNIGRHAINVTFQPPVGARMTVASGNGQFGPVMQPLAEPLLVEVKDEVGNPVAGRVINFEVTRNSGTLKKDEDGEPMRIAQVPTDGSGRAMVLFTLGDTAGEGTNRVRATAVGVSGEVEFCASGLAGSADKIVMTMGDNQRGVVGHPLAMPLVSLVVDRDGNPIKEIPVTFTVVSGNGNLDGQQNLERITGTDGLARAVLTLGPDPGLNNNLVTATFPGMTGLPATFVASGLSPGNPDETRFGGTVVDSSFTPIPAATVFVKAANGFMTTTATNDEGQFLLESVPVGLIHLRIEGTTIDRPETFPSLEFETVTVAGQANILGQPIVIPPLDTEGSKIVGGDQDVTLSMKGVPGLALTVLANSVTCPPGAPDRTPDGKQCRVMISQVHLDKVPMPPPNGTFFMPPAWTVQPPGVNFDPPARITIPNTGLPPGRMVDIFQFDHSLFQFVNIGKGTVSEDGLVIVSDPGFGITHAGWGGAAPPQPPPTCGDACGDGNFCNGDESCQNGQCAPGTPKPPDTPLPANEQKPNDCKTLLCQGSEPNDNETPDVKDPQCNICSGGEPKPDETKEKQTCDTTGDPTRSCHVCQKGECKVPDCNPGSFTNSTTLTSGPIFSRLKNFEDLINNSLKVALKGKPVNAKVKFKVTGTIKESFDCCPDCTVEKPTDNGWKKAELELGASIEGTASIGVCPDNACKFLRAFDFFGSPHRVSIGLTDSPSVSLTGSVSGSGGGSAIEECPEETCGFAKGEITLKGEAKVALGAEAVLQEFDGTDSNCPPDSRIRLSMAKEIHECWGDPILGISAQAFARLNAPKLASVEARVDFALPGGQCQNEGGSCKMTALKASLELGYKVSGIAGQVTSDLNDSIPVFKFNGFTSQCF